MADDVATADKPLTQDEVRKAMLHLAASIHNLQASLEEVTRRLGTRIGVTSPPVGERALNVSRLQLAEALKILVKDPSDG
jgi:hypothetical protein